jgi:RNA recognition motif-containing protein
MTPFPMPGANMIMPQYRPFPTFPTLYVGDLEDQVTEGMLYNYFIKFGHIYSVRVIHKKSRGFGYVAFYNLRDAENAKNNANHEKLLKN